MGNWSIPDPGLNQVWVCNLAEKKLQKQPLDSIGVALVKETFLGLSYSINLLQFNQHAPSSVLQGLRASQGSGKVDPSHCKGHPGTDLRS